MAVRQLPGIVPKVELAQVLRKIVATDMVINAVDATLEICKIALDCVGMNGTANVLPLRVIDGLVSLEFPARGDVARVLVRK